MLDILHFLWYIPLLLVIFVLGTTKYWKIEKNKIVIWAIMCLMVDSLIGWFFVPELPLRSVGWAFLCSAIACKRVGYSVFDIVPM
jgi:hypothetical protein